MVLDRYAGPETQFHALRTRGAGRRSFVTCHLLAPGSWTVRQGHDLIEQIEGDIHEVLVNVTITVHLEPLEDPRSFADVGLDRRARTSSARAFGATERPSRKTS